MKIHPKFQGFEVINMAPDADEIVIKTDNRQIVVWRDIHGSVHVTIGLQDHSHRGEIQLTLGKED